MDNNKRHKDYKTVQHDTSGINPKDTFIEDDGCKIQNRNNAC